MPVGEIDYLQLWNVSNRTINPMQNTMWTYTALTTGQLSPVAGFPTVYNITLVAANTEYAQVLSFALPNTAHRYQMQALQSVAIRFAFELGKVAAPVSPYLTLAADRIYESGELNKSSSRNTLRIYLASSVAGTVVQFIVFA